MQSWTIIILGATGNLARTRLIPTLYKLLEDQPVHGMSFVFIGAAKDSVDWPTFIREAIHTHNNTLLTKFIEHSSYQTVDFEDYQSFENLAAHVELQEKRFHLSGNRLIYLAAASQFYCAITKQAVASGLIKKQQTLSKSAHRIVYEKPFGWDSQSAHEINECIKNLIDEEQIYRVDHYVTKALTTSITFFRFSNILFEPLWNKDYIEQIQIILDEKGAITGRGSFYDRYGALKDVVQNHMFQLLTYIALDRPTILDADQLGQAKVNVLKHVRVIDGILGQYEGYRQEPDVRATSNTETYALLTCEITTERWKNVPIYFRTGKALNRKTSEMHVIFKPVSKEIIREQGFFAPDRLILHVSPYSGAILKLNIQRGFEHAIAPMIMDFCYRCEFEDQPHSYEALLYDIMQGDKLRSVSAEEIYYAWRIIEQIHQLSLPLYTYEQGTTGPKEAEAFARKYGILWFKNND